MRIHNLPFLLFFALLCSAYAVADEVVVVNESSTRIFKGPSIKTPVIAFAQKGETYTALVIYSEWIKIHYKETEGWVAVRDVSILRSGVSEKADAHEDANRHYESRTLPNPPDVRSNPEPESKETFSATTADSMPVAPASVGEEPVPQEYNSPINPSSARKFSRKRFRPGIIPSDEYFSVTAVDSSIQGRADSLVELDRIDSLIPDNLFAISLNSGLKIYASPDTSSRVIILIPANETLDLIKRTRNWLYVFYRGVNGWVKRDYVEVVTLQETETEFNSRTLWLYIIAATIVFILVIVFSLVTANNAKRRKSRGNILLFEKEPKYIPEIVTNRPILIESCFSKYNYKTIKINNLDELTENIINERPHLILVDWDMDPSIAHDVEHTIFKGTTDSNILVIFYNVPSPDDMSGMMKLGNVFYLGREFTALELLSVVTPDTMARTKTRHIRKSSKSWGLDGQIDEKGLEPVFQFIYNSHKTGSLVIKGTQTGGLIYFEDGIITYAQSRERTGQPAIEEFLNTHKGSFVFDADKNPPGHNCSIPVMKVLMEWAQKHDETRQFKIKNEKRSKH
jgi:uncharacterized protein YraI